MSQVVISYSHTDRFENLSVDTFKAQDRAKA